MDILAGEISAMVFKRVVRKDVGEFSFDSHMLSVLMEMDGKQSVAMIAKKSGLNMVDLREILTKLLRLKLIEPSPDAIRMLGKDFYDTLGAELSMAIGPIAEVLIEDAVSDLGLKPGQIPNHRAAELVELLSREIQREEKKAAFKQSMVKKIREMEY